MEEQVQQMQEQTCEQEPVFSLYEGPELRQLKSDNERLQQRIHELGRQAQAKFQSLGSMRSVGRAPQTDSFLIGFDQD